MAAPAALAGPIMHLTLLESDRSFLRSAECAFLSILAHAAVIWLALDMSAGAGQLPEDEREARVFFLLPPDRQDVPLHQSDNIDWGKLGGELEGDPRFTTPGGDLQLGGPAYRAQPRGRRVGARGELPFAPAPMLFTDTAFSVLDVDQMVERYEGSGAPIYPRDLIATGTEGQVRAIYVVDTAGRVDMTTIRVVQSDDPRFTESVRTALGGMRFRPAKRGGRTVRQLVEQRFRFRITPPSKALDQIS
jgi:TonB family protein